MKSKTSIVTLSALMLTWMVAPASAITFDVGLDTSQEIPAPNLGGASPTGAATVDVNTISGAVTINGTYAGTTSDVAAAHLHGMAPAGETAGVIFGLDVTGGTSGSLSGGADLSAENLTGLLSGLTYINVHTADNGPGELRGQVVDSDVRVFNIALDAVQEIPPPTLAGATPSGSARVVVDTSNGMVEISGGYSGMTSNVAAAHLHGLASPGDTAGVVFGLEVSGGLDGTFSGSAMLSNENLAGLLSGQTYINVHTANNGPGEIRGQVPEPSSALLFLLGMVAFVRRQAPAAFYRR